MSQTFFEELLYGVRNSVDIEVDSVEDYLLDRLAYAGYEMNEKVVQLISEADDIFDRSGLTVREVAGKFEVVDRGGLAAAAPFASFYAAQMHRDAISILLAFDHLAETIGYCLRDCDTAKLTAMLGIADGREWILLRKSAGIAFPLPIPRPQSPEPAMLAAQLKGRRRKLWAQGLRNR